MNINVVYNDGDDSEVCFPEMLKLMYYQNTDKTKVESKKALLIYY